MNDQNNFRVMTPVTLDNGKTIWNKVGAAFKNYDSSKKHEMVISLTSLPLSAFSREEIKLYVFPDTSNYNRQNNQEPERYQPTKPPVYDDDVPF